MACPNCDSTNIMVQKYDPAEADEVPGIMIMAIVILCKSCGWGFNCTGTLDNRKKSAI